MALLVAHLHRKWFKPHSGMRRRLFLSPTEVVHGRRVLPAIRAEHDAEEEIYVTSTLGQQWASTAPLPLARRFTLTAITLTNVVFPEYCRPTRVSSISSFQKSALNQSNSLLISAIIFVVW